MLCQTRFGNFFLNSLSLLLNIAQIKCHSLILIQPLSLLLLISFVFTSRHPFFHVGHKLGMGVYPSESAKMPVMMNN